MLLVAQVLAFGACLVTQSKAAPSAPSVSIFLKPPGVISPGGSTTICCSCQCANGHFVLYKNGHRLRALELPGSRAEFTLSNASWGDAGVYSCQYLAGGSLLALSEGLDVVVQELLLPAPALSVLPGPEHQEAFSISHAREGDGGRYSCQCFTQAAAIFNWSAASQPLELVVRGTAQQDLRAGKLDTERNFFYRSALETSVGSDTKVRNCFTGCDRSLGLGFCFPPWLVWF
ncbi:immunoglobulin superfamily member 1-like isoform X3 [Pogoniulus pusillus]|uniref:immunoglobulin superfamily member 1-like isoform X3 n=1 Tax=Pogoniulus pusillus TaxID=488313 RepID=UPI0030B930D1